MHFLSSWIFIILLSSTFFVSEYFMLHHRIKKKEFQKLFTVCCGKTEWIFVLSNSCKHKKLKAQSVVRYIVPRVQSNTNWTNRILLPPHSAQIIFMCHVRSEKKKTLWKNSEKARKIQSIIGFAAEKPLMCADTCFISSSGFMLFWRMTHIWKFSCRWWWRQLSVTSPDHQSRWRRRKKRE